MERPRTEPRARARDAGLARLRRATRLTIVGATALAGAFAALAAYSAPGHKAPTTVAAARHAVARAQNSTRAPSAAPAVTDDGQVSSQPAQAVAPAPTTVAPVVVSGGS